MKANIDVPQNIGMYYTIIPSPCGTIGFVYKKKKSDAEIIRVLLPHHDMSMRAHIAAMFPHVQSYRSRVIDDLCKKIKQFLTGTPIIFSLQHLDFSQLYAFQKKVLLLERKIPYGRVSTYGRLAHKLGRPGAARAVGQALARNPFPLIIPCHRTIKSDGSLGGFSGGIALKRWLLEREGIRFDERGYVVMKGVW
jgi:methylated-DNA-[protein]-cysteine S-methyltransferase